MCADMTAIARDAVLVYHNKQHDSNNKGHGVRMYDVSELLNACMQL